VPPQLHRKFEIRTLGRRKEGRGEDGKRQRSFLGQDEKGQLYGRFLPLQRGYLNGGDDILRADIGAYLHTLLLLGALLAHAEEKNAEKSAFVQPADMRTALDKALFRRAV
jgi:hypothetical protein